MTRFESSQFSFKGLEGTAEVSDLFGRSCPPAQFEVRWTRTGEVRQFDHVDLERDREGDVIAWVFESLGRGLLDKNVTLRLWND